MRLLHFLAERGYSGGEVQLRYLVEHLQRSGHDNHLVLAPGARFAEVARELGMPFHEVDLRRPLRPSTRRRVRAAVAAVRPDVVHFGCGRSLLWGGFWSRGLPVRLRVTTRRIDYPVKPGWFHGGRYRRLVDHTVANSEGVRRAVLAGGVPPERVTVVYEGIEMAPWDDLSPRREEARLRLGLQRDAVVASCPATLRPRKGQRGLVRAFAAAAAGHPRAVLVLAGIGSDRAPLLRMIEDLGLQGRVLLPGQVNPVADLYAASDLVCMASFNEGLSNACLEASAAGLPLVVSQAGGLPEIVADGETGAVVPCGDEGALAQALRRYLDDPDLRARAGAAGAVRTRGLFTEKRMAEGMEALLTDLLAGRPA